LWLHRDRNVGAQVIEKFFQGTYKRTQVFLTLNNLRRSLHVDRLPGAAASYTLTGLGVEVATAYVQRLVNFTLNF
jgi:hypothetical protein